jgi:UDP-glucose 4-epimerase
MKHYFVTGGTGVVGSALVAMLLRVLPDAEVWLLVRAKDTAALARRTDELFRFWALGRGEVDARRRVHALRGDATMPQFGLALPDYQTLLAKVTHIVHAAGAVRMTLPLDEARRSAVDSARQIVALAEALRAAGQLRKVEMVSTVGVGGRMRVVPEEWITAPREFHNTYEQSKAEAEDLVREAVAGGLPITLHRPSMVVGDSQSGRVVHFQVFYHLCEFLSGRRTRGLFPPLQGQSLDVVPSDFVARVIVWSSTREDLAGRILHLCVGPEGTLPLELLRKRMRDRLRARDRALPRLITLPRSLFTRLLALVSRFLDERSRRAVATLPVFLDYLSSRQQFESRRTTDLLQQQACGIALPRWQEYLDLVLDRYLDAHEA